MIGTCGCSMNARERLCPLKWRMCDGLIKASALQCQAGATGGCTFCMSSLGMMSQCELHSNGPANPGLAL